MIVRILRKVAVSGVWLRPTSASANLLDSNLLTCCQHQQEVGFVKVHGFGVEQLEVTAKIMGIIIYHWTCGQKPHLIKNGRKIDCNTANHVPFVVPGLSTSSSTSSSPSSPTSSSQDTATPTEHPASTRSENMSEEVQGNLSHGPAESENPNKNDDNEEVRGNLSHDLPELLTGVQARSGR